MRIEHKTAIATALFLILLGAGSIMYGPRRDALPVVVPLAVAAVAPQAAVREREHPRDLIVPIAGVAASALSDSWGAPRSGGRHHQGIDIMVPSGTPVRAAAAGTIAKLYTSERGGITIYQFDEKRRLILYYAHLRGYEVGLAEGQRVAQGQVIGYVGSTGNAGTPHLHFEVQHANAAHQWWRGEAVNPYRALQVGYVETDRVLRASLAGVGR